MAPTETCEQHCQHYGGDHPCCWCERIEDNNLESVFITGAKRAHLQPSEFMTDWWVGFGKDESCQFEGTWLDMVVVAAKILRHTNTKKVAPNLYQPDIPLTEAQEHNY